MGPAEVPKEAVKTCSSLPPRCTPRPQQAQKKRTFSEGNYAVINHRHTQKGVRRERLPRQEKEKALLACQEIWEEASPGGLLEHGVSFCPCASEGPVGSSRPWPCDPRCLPTFSQMSLP